MRSRGANAPQTFGWMTALMRKGTKQFITEKDLPPLLDHDKSENLGEDLRRALKKQYAYDPYQTLNSR